MNKVLLMVICLLACDNAETTSGPLRSNGPIRPSLSYYKDPRTDICFAASDLGYKYAVLTAVPCSPEVEKMLKPFPPLFMTDE